MFTTEQYRTKAAEYSKLVKSANGPKEVIEFQNLERSFTELADNAQWVTEHHDQTLHTPKHVRPELKRVSQGSLLIDRPRNGR